MSDQDSHEHVANQPLRLRWILAVRNAEMPRLDKLIAFVLSTYFDAEGVCFPGVTKRLVPEVGASRRAIQEGLRRLEAHGWIRTVQRSGTSSLYFAKEGGKAYCAPGAQPSTRGGVLRCAGGAQPSTPELFTYPSEENSFTEPATPDPAGEGDPEDVPSPSWRCSACDYETTEEPEELVLYECSRCGEVYDRESSADGDSNRCATCNVFGALLTRQGCPECGQGEMEEEATRQALQLYPDSARFRHGVYVASQYARGVPPETGFYVIDVEQGQPQDPDDALIVAGPFRLPTEAEAEAERRNAEGVPEDAKEAA